ncbi:lipocalin family protein [Mycolicibacterium sp. CH28]|uniref:lipocalin family protein n=1 Tax=Mycolicibacterium sp. CH28 TaxID=2512237 RepID=UPI0013866470|nr:lipocalin family protein [Mycolicibacterium sp. CH28]
MSAAPSIAVEPTPAASGLGVSRRAVVAAARQAQINQLIASAGTVTATSGAQPATGLAATAMFSLLSGLAVQPRQTAATTTTALAPVTTSAPLLPAAPTNGVTGVLVGHSTLVMPGAFIGNAVAADWYFPTQADGSVKAQGVIWLQHGFAATNTFYSALATNLAQQTDSIVVAPTLSSLPLTFSGGCLTCVSSQQAAAAMFEDPNRTALLDSALAAGYTGVALPTRFVLAGHSAGGGFATATAADFITGSPVAQDANLAGVVMFDGVSNGALDGSLAQQLSELNGVPVYQIAAPAQGWNLFGATTNVLGAARPGQFIGVVLQGGSHVDSMLGVNPLFDAVLQLVTKPVPAGNTAATYTLSTGWINDMYAGATPEDPKYGLYAAANQQIIMGPTAAFGLPAAQANQLSFGDKIVKSLIDTVGGLFGFQLPAPVNSGNNGLDPNTAVVKPPNTNGVTGVRTGSSVLDIPCGPYGYVAPANWYFPTQADGTVQANGVIWLQHGFLGFNDWYGTLAQQLAQQTNSIVVAPDIFWFNTPLCPGCYLGGEQMREAVASMFEGSRSALNVSANAAGFQGALPQKFILTGHSAGGNFATGVAGLIADPANNNSAISDLLGVVMFDGVAQADLFAQSIGYLDAAGIPDYQIAGAPQSWNAWGATTEQYALLHPGQFTGVQIDNGSHTDVIAGDNLFAWLGEIASAIIVKPSPPGAKAAVRTLATGWINDIYAGTGPGDPVYGTYGNPNDGTYVPNQSIVLGEAGATTVPAPPPVDVARYANGQPWYEQGSVKLPFEWGLTNTTATYSVNPDGSVKVENSGNFLVPNGPRVNIVGTAVPVNPAFNTRLNVGFFFGTPGNTEPGNYWILDYAPDYSWAIVSDPTGFSGYILTRDQTVPAAEYDTLVARARQLGVWGPITPTRQDSAAIAV